MGVPREQTMLKGHLPLSLSQALLYLERAERLVAAEAIFSKNEEATDVNTPELKYHPYLSDFTQSGTQVFGFGGMGVQG